MTRLPKVVITDFVADDLAPERRILDGVAEVDAINARSEEDLSGRIDEAAALMVYHNIRLTEKTIARLRRCKLIVRCGVGYDNVDCAVAGRRGIPVANVPDYGSEEVADTAIGMALSLTRGIALLNSRLRRGEGPWFYTQAVPCRRLRGQVFGIVGLGRIGTATAIRAKALGLDVAFYDPYKPDGYDKAMGIRRVDDLGDLLSQAFILSLHCPLTDETRGIIDGEALGRMPRGSYLINTARGGLVDSASIPAAIASGQLAGAGIDVLPHEPPQAFDPLIAAWRDPEHPAHDRVLINPHAAFYSEEALLEMRTKGAEACRRALLGKGVNTVVNSVVNGECNGEQNGERDAAPKGSHCRKGVLHAPTD
ncbi:MAG TPA: C-terminal binding protein [Planctomycetaceae bacterium]|nr:C-terminal binding protein [Planctomycetaceae bacterium]